LTFIIHYKNIVINQTPKTPKTPKKPIMTAFNGLTAIVATPRTLSKTRTIAPTTVLRIMRTIPFVLKENIQPRIIRRIRPERNPRIISKVATLTLY